MKVYGYATQGAEENLAAVAFERTDPREGEVAIKITHCGICHSDLHQARNDWGNTKYPCVPGHEIAGVVTAVGAGVSKYQEGDRVGIGCMVNSCQECPSCEADEEQYCSGPKSCTLTYNGSKFPDGKNTYGGYSTDIVVREEFVVRVPDELDQAKVGPILCAGITVYAPMKKLGLKVGQTLGVAGIGGLGHMAVKLGKALGAKVVAFTRNEEKKDEILAMGADEVVISKNEKEMEAAAMSLDMLIDTIPVAHDIAPYIALMAPNSHLVVVGNLESFPEFSPAPLIFHGISIHGSLIGGIADTQEVVDLCAQHGITPATKLISIEEVNQAYDELAAGGGNDFRHVIDLETLRELEAVREGSAPEIPAPDRGEVVGRH
ncbi:NAD(P)-dependent alcohol dehydrogenase [Roseibacillus ishigakijimensis]|uniref:NAD(P)-dependent alcohol dehydrogenase n=1 Tax=Roseibacillus ishigakijimensis TaxID=454146 RepID=A0A934RUW6_9BACT|nr:NAD(P)-dependent alcohol dehydrogenase [Roseibacillus ishigakijimensis]MBK1835449.1 NAD(P)-dependent alcohol dehydrogenase [Roseibacillus ishigakijimensis]